MAAHIRTAIYFYDQQAKKRDKKFLIFFKLPLQNVILSD
jgi:hypothetical protein